MKVVVYMYIYLLCFISNFSHDLDSYTKEMNMKIWKMIW